MWQIDLNLRCRLAWVGSLQTLVASFLLLPDAQNFQKGITLSGSISIMYWMEGIKHFNVLSQFLLHILMLSTFCKAWSQLLI
jgi:hypothetical protein